MALDRTWYNTLVDDSGLGTDGTILDKADIDALMDAVDAALAAISPAAGQLTFPSTQNASSNANTLDDYEEGTWTPVLGGFGGTSGQSYTVQQGEYVKIGQLCLLTARLTLSNKGTITGSVVVSGFPFTTFNGAAASAGAAIPYFSAFATSYASIGAIVFPNATLAVLQAVAAGGGTGAAALTTANVNNTSDLVFTTCYRTNS